MLVRVPVGSTTIEVNVWNPLYALAPLVLLLFSIPLAVFATVTTSFALSLLFLRASVVYLQLAVALAAAWISPAPPKTYSSFPRTPLALSPMRTCPRSRRLSRSIIGSADSQLHDRKGSFTTLIGESGVARDFEGMGGWRTAGDEDEALWMNMNSRLELPAEPVQRRHQRSLTAGATPGQRHILGSEPSRTSPVQVRARTPVRFVLDEGEDYFEPTSSLRPLSSVSDPAKRHSRRKSGSGSSSSSTVSGTAIIKEPGP